MSCNSVGSGVVLGDSNHSRTSFHGMKSKDKLGSSTATAATAASPAAAGKAVRNDPLTMSDLVDYFASGCKPKSRWRVGTEHEKFGFYKDTLKPLDYKQISRILDAISSRYKWEKVFENGNIIGLQKDGQSISLEPGGQLELSGAPLNSLHETADEIKDHLSQVKDVCNEMGVGFMGMGFHPKWPLETFPLVPKGRAEIEWNYMPKVGNCGPDVMLRTCTVQVNLDFASEEDMIRKFRVSLALQPVATAIFASSPFKEGVPNGYLSYRSLMYTDLDGDRTGDLPFVFEDDFSFQKYVEYALEVPMLFVCRNNGYIDCTGRSFKDFLAGKLPELPGELPTLSDFEEHISTIFPEVRLKRYLEMRGADGGPTWEWLCALPALWVGLLYDDQSLESAYKLIREWTQAERAMLRRNVPKMGLKTPFRGGILRDVAQVVLKLAREGLERRGLNEQSLLDDIAEIVETGVTPAEKLLDLYHSKWNKSVDPVFHELEY